MSCSAQANYVPCGCRAHLNEKDPRAEIWLAVFGKLEFPLLHPIAHIGQAVGEPPYRVLQGDWRALSEEEQNMLAEQMRTKFGASPAAFLAQNKAIGYIPIKDKNITVVCCKLHSRMLMF